MQRPVVAITRCSTYEQAPLLKALNLVIGASDFPEVKGKSVLLKPNILSDAPVGKAITTHPEFLRAVISILFDRGAKTIYVGDSPGLHGNHFTPLKSGIDAVCRETGAQWVNFAHEPVSRKIPFTYGRHLPFPSILDEVDLLFSLAKMKSHQLMYFTGAVKNMFGLVPGLHKSASHMRYPTVESFSRLIAGLYAAAPPDFSFIDGIVAMEGAGPANGDIRYAGLVMASKDAATLDMSMAAIMGYDIEQMPLLRELSRKRLTKASTLEDISFSLLDAHDLVISDFKRIPQQQKIRMLRTLIGPLFTRRFKFHIAQNKPKPLFDNEACISCGKCIAICPGNALQFDAEKHIQADYSACIRCYCCAEVCPADAIHIEHQGEQ
ncbi:MAG: DUF362 domain-containing protein [Sphaerochaetaceae bacterium]|nr:DUF362 domain-containing protein [Sphaerochaetaceae bacterium]